MKFSVFAATTLVLAAGMVGTASAANVNLVNEDFDGLSGAIKGQSHTNLTWSASGSNDASTVDNGKLKIRTEGDTLTAAIAQATTNTLAQAITNGVQDASGEIYIDAKVKFEPSDELEVFTGNDDLKFAIYAYANEDAMPPSTNLIVYASGGNETITNIVFTPENVATERRLVVTMKNDNGLKFQVKVDNVVASNANDVSWFSVRSAALPVSSINFQGTGEIDDLKVGYVTEQGWFSGGTTIGDVTLSDGEASYLNSHKRKTKLTESDITTKIAKLTQKQLDDAYLANIVITDADAANAYTFGIKGIKRDGNNVVVTIELNRGEHSLGAINGTLDLQGSTDNQNFTSVGSKDLSDGDFSEGDVTTATFTAGEAKIFKAVISSK